MIVEEFTQLTDALNGLIYAIRSVDAHIWMLQTMLKYTQPDCDKRPQIKDQPFDPNEILEKIGVNPWRRRIGT